MTVVADVLQRLATSTPGELLGRLAAIVLDVTDADRATVHVVEGARLRPSVSIRGGGEPAPPIEVGDDRAASLLASPRASVDILADGSLALVPVVRAGEPVAVLALEWRDGEVRREDLRLLEAVAAFAGAR